MPERPVYWVNDRNPSLSDQIFNADGTNPDLSSATVTAKMRAFGSSTLKINRAVDSKDASGNWRVDWQASDLDTAGEYLFWIEVATAGATQTVWEAPLEVRAHSNSGLYIELEQLKATAELTGHTFADADLRAAINAACRAIDNICGRRFYPDSDALQVRYYTPLGRNGSLPIDDLVTVTSVEADTDGDGVFEQTWTNNTDYVLEPLNAAADGRPWDTIRLHPSSAVYLPAYPRSVKVTAKFGWLTTPAAVVEAATLVASRLAKRAREAPFGVAGVGIDGEAIRIAGSDSDVAMLLNDYVRVKA